MRALHERLENKKKCWHSEIESLSNIIKYALKEDGFEQKFKRRNPNLLPLYFIILWHCVSTDARIHVLYNRHIPTF